MMPKLEVETKEVQALINKIEERGGEIAEYIADEVAYTALMIESDAKKRCPVRTGRLRASIKAFTSKSPISAVVGTNVEYARVVEFGGKRRRAKPYLYPAYFYWIGKLKETLQNALGC